MLADPTEPGMTSVCEDAAADITTAEMDREITSYKALEANYKALKAESDNAYDLLSTQKDRIIHMLEQTGKTVYIAEGVARVKLTHEMSYQTPKTVEEKEAFFAWLAREEGEEVMMNYRTVNSQSLNSLLNEMEERYAREGKVLNPEGVGAPIARAKLSVTKA